MYLIISSIANPVTAAVVLENAGIIFPTIK